jgi:uncharacterized protein (DUF1499 family)
MSRIKKRMIFSLAVIVILSPAIGLAILSASARRPQDLGVLNGRFAPCPGSPNCVSTQATDREHRIEPIPFAEPTDRVIARLKSAMAAVPRLRVVTEKDDYIHAEATSLIFRFVDDVEFFVEPAAKLIHFRSASRVGHSDLGVNRGRMEQIRRAFEQRPAP